MLKFFVSPIKTYKKRSKMIDVTSLFCNIDDFWIEFKPEWEKFLISEKRCLPKRTPMLSESEVMTIIIFFHISGYRNFKQFYLGYVCKYLKPFFPLLPSYNRMVELKKTVLFPLYCYLMKQNREITGIGFIDSSPIRVCHLKRSSRHRVFKGFAKKGKTSTGYFFGFKLHLLINDKGEILCFMLTPGNVDDRVPVETLIDHCNFVGKLCGDRGYISSDLSQRLVSKGVQLITRLKKNMKNKLMSVYDKLLLRKRGIIETIIDQLKNVSQIEHTRHRSPINFLVNLLGGLIAYAHQPKKPSLNLEIKESLAYAL